MCRVFLLSLVRARSFSSRQVPPRRAVRSSEIYERIPVSFRKIIGQAKFCSSRSHLRASTIVAFLGDHRCRTCSVRAPAVKLWTHEPSRRDPEIIAEWCSMRSKSSAFSAVLGFLNIYRRLDVPVPSYDRRVVIDF